MLQTFSEPCWYPHILGKIKNYQNENLEFFLISFLGSLFYTCHCLPAPSPPSYLFAFFKAPSICSLFLPPPSSSYLEPPAQSPPFIIKLHHRSVLHPS